MNCKKISAFGIVVSMTACLLAGCGISKSTPSQEEAEPASPITEPAAEPAPPTPEPTGNEVDTVFSFADVSALEFWFGSGVGAWCTVLTIHADGTFEGTYHDSDMGISGDAYPNGTCYLCDFTGAFTQPEQVDENTYSVKIAEITLKNKPDTEEIQDGVKYIYSEPYGLDNAEELLFYLPGTPVDTLPEGYRSWMMVYGEFADTTLPFYGLYNAHAEEGFYSYEKTA